MPALNLWIKDGTSKLLNRAKLVFIKLTGDTKATNDKVIYSSLVEYLNKNDK